MSTERSAAGKVKDKVFKAYRELPPVAKGIVGVTVAIGVIYAGYKLYHKIWPSDKEKRDQDYKSAVDSDIRNYQDAGFVPSFSSSEYASMANTIFNSMNSCLVGDDYDAVVEEMKRMQNDLDVAWLKKSFGLRKNECAWISYGSGLDLFTFVKDELEAAWDPFFLGSDRISQINSNWESKGISYRI